MDLPTERIRRAAAAGAGEGWRGVCVCVWWSAARGAASCWWGDGFSGETRASDEMRDTQWAAPRRGHLRTAVRSGTDTCFGCGLHPETCRVYWLGTRYCECFILANLGKFTRPHVLRHEGTPQLPVANSCGPWLAQPTPRPCKTLNSTGSTSIQRSPSPWRTAARRVMHSPTAWDSWCSSLCATSSR